MERPWERNRKEGEKRKEVYRDETPKRKPG